MNRKEQILKAAHKECSEPQQYDYKNIEFITEITWFLKGAEWADQNPNFIDETTKFTESDIDFILKNKKLNSALEIAVGALEFYSNFDAYTMSHASGDYEPDICSDSGEKANIALAKIKEIMK